MNWSIDEKNLFDENLRNVGFLNKVAARWIKKSCVSLETAQTYFCPESRRTKVDENEAMKNLFRLKANRVGKIVFWTKNFSASSNLFCLRAKCDERKSKMKRNDSRERTSCDTDCSVESRSSQILNQKECLEKQKSNWKGFFSFFSFVFSFSSVKKFERRFSVSLRF